MERSRAGRRIAVENPESDIAYIEYSAAREEDVFNPNVGPVDARPGYHPVSGVDPG